MRKKNRRGVVGEVCEWSGRVDGGGGGWLVNLFDKESIFFRGRYFSIN